MSDPFQDVDAAGADFVANVVKVLETRAAEPVMVGIVEAYLDHADFPEGGLHIEIGAGSGAVTRRMAARAGRGQAIGTDPSDGLIAAAAELGRDIANLSFETADGTALRFDDASVDTVVMHTVLSHVTAPEALLAEAFRVLKPGGKLIICDADFEKTSIGIAAGDPMQACAIYFVENFVTDKYLVGKLRALVRAAGLAVEHFGITPRVITEGAGAMSWVGIGGADMVAKGLISADLHKALIAEHDRRMAEGSFYGLQPFATLVAQKPG